MEQAWRHELYARQGAERQSEAAHGGGVEVGHGASRVNAVAMGASCCQTSGRGKAAVVTKKIIIIMLYISRSLP